MVKLWAFLDCVLGCLVFGANKNGDRKFLDSCSAGRAVCICSGHKRCYAIAGFRYIFHVTYCGIRVLVLADLLMIYIPCLVTRKISRCICRFSFAAD